MAGDADGFVSADEDDDEADGTMLLPLHNDNPRPNAGLGLATPTPGKGGRIRLDDVWDEREELFGIGDSDSEDESHAGRRREPQNRPSSTNPSHHQPEARPKIIVTPSS